MSRSLAPAWSYSTGDMATHAGAMERASFENTPILAGGRLYVCSPFDEVSALDPGTGRQIWRFDPKIDATVRYPTTTSAAASPMAIRDIRGRCGNAVCSPSRIYLDTARPAA